MKVVILAGGYGTRISEESHLKPKPMIEIGDMPILLHIMKIYSHFGFNEFVICLGYKGNTIKEFFSNYFIYGADVTFDFRNNEEKCRIHSNDTEPWEITLANTGKETLTGGRIKKIHKYIGDRPFMLTYGDGVADININELVAFHKKANKLVTVTAVQPLGRFGALEIEDGQVTNFLEKPSVGESWINAGFFVCQPGVFKYLDGDDTMFEQGPLQKIAQDNELAAYKHRGFWQPMDTLREKKILESLWEKGEAPWKLW